MPLGLKLRRLTLEVNMLMKTLHRFAPIACLAGALSLMGAFASATNVEITFENFSSAGGVWNTPLFLGFHNGSFDTADLMVAASASVELIAEEGDRGNLLNDISMVPGAKSAVLLGDDARSALSIETR